MEHVLKHQNKHSLQYNTVQVKQNTRKTLQED